jgi:hypothetical protein
MTLSRSGAVVTEAFLPGWVEAGPSVTLTAKAQQFGFQSSEACNEQHIPALCFYGQETMRSLLKRLGPLTKVETRMVFRDIDLSALDYGTLDRHLGKSLMKLDDGLCVSGPTLFKSLPRGKPDDWDSVSLSLVNQGSIAESLSVPCLSTRFSLR